MLNITLLAIRAPIMPIENRTATDNKNINHIYFLLYSSSESNRHILLYFCKKYIEIHHLPAPQMLKVKYVCTKLYIGDFVKLYRF